MVESVQVPVRCSIRPLSMALSVTAALFCWLLTGLEVQAQQPALDLRETEQVASMMVRANALASKGELVNALERYTTIAQGYPQTDSAAEALWQIHRIQVLRDNPEGAFEALDRLAAGQPGHFEKAQAAQLDLVRKLMDSSKDSRRTLERTQPADETKPEVIAAMLKRIVQLGPFSEPGIKAAHLLALATERQGDTADAMAMHEQFVERHGDHELADDAAYQTAYIQYKKWKDMRGESPRYREAAAVALSYFIARYPESSKAPQARTCLADVRESEYRELLGLIRYYEGLDRPEAAAVYYRELGEKFPDVVIRSPDLLARIRDAAEMMAGGGDTKGPKEE